MPFSTLGLSPPLLRALADRGYDRPTPIQVEAIPAILAGREVLAAAQTGTGKSAAFILPLLQRLAGGPQVKANHVRALILTPTRELAEQVGASVASYGRYLPLKSAIVYGGVKINPQMMKLRSGADLLVATPGRLLDLYRQNAVRFAQVELLVLDEADRMLDLGFSAELSRILDLLPKHRQTLLFSATFSAAIRTLGQALLHHPLTIAISPTPAPADNLNQAVRAVDAGQKPALLSQLLRQRWQGQVLVFVRTREGADRLVTQLERDGITATALHGDKSQSARQRALAEFKTEKIRVLIATDLAARGLDIPELPVVINFDLPKVAQDYIHRIGRTSRAGRAGEAISLVSADEAPLLAAIEGLLGQSLERETTSDFLPTRPLPPSRPLPVRAKRPKKAKRKEGETPPSSLNGR